jgi:hypothetical protein
MSLQSPATTTCALASRAKMPCTNAATARACSTRITRDGFGAG